MDKGDLNIAPGKPIAIVRLDDLSEAVALSRALLDGGIMTLEFTLTNPAALRAVEQVRAEFGERMIVGAGTVLDAAAARDCISAGAEFLVSPALLPDVIETAIARNVTMLSGAYSPTEILAAWRAGSHIIKVFPARNLGPAYIKDVLAPLPMLRLVPTGGVDLSNCRNYIDAGAYSVAIGSNLVDPKAVARKDWAAITAMAAAYVRACGFQTS